MATKNSWLFDYTETLIRVQIKTKITMDKRTEIHSGLTKEQAYNLMLEGHKICHEYYADDEYLYMMGSTIYDENGYNMGNYMDDFWQKIQKWETGWMTTNAR